MLAEINEKINTNIHRSWFKMWGMFLITLRKYNSTGTAFKGVKW